MVHPIPPIVMPTNPATNITPFTYRDGLTYLQRLERIVKYINNVVKPYVDESYNELAEATETQINLVITQFNLLTSELTQQMVDLDAEVDQEIIDLQDSVNQSITDLTTFVNTNITNLTIYVDNAVDQVVNDSIELQDPVAAALINDDESETATALYAKIVNPRVVQSVEASRAASLMPFHRALMLRDEFPVNVLAVGHSFIHGAGGSGVIDIKNRFTDRLLGELRRLHPTDGVNGGRGSFAANSGVNSGYPLIHSGSPNINANYGIGIRSYQMSGSQTLTFTFEGSGADIIWTRNTGLGVFAYMVDGGDPVEVVATGSLLPGNVEQVRGLVPGTHTIIVSVVSGTVLIENMVEYNGDESAGIRMWNGGRGSMQTTNFVPSETKHWHESVAYIDPALVIIALFENNYGGASYTPVSSAQTKMDLTAIMAGIRAQCTTPPSIVIVNEYPRQDVGSSNHIEPWANYTAVAYELADEDSSGEQGQSLVTVFDLEARFGSIPTPSQGLIGSDNVHPSVAGHRLWAESLARFLTPA